ncbi:hypothetical protein BH11CYA1_BH11CYA1_46510 [soil metagenome]
MAQRAESDRSAQELVEPSNSFAALHKEVQDLRLAGTQSEKIEAKAESSQAAKDDSLTYLIKIKPEQLGHGMQQAREAAVALEGEKDIKGAAASYQPKFEAAVKQTDSDFNDAFKENWGKVNLARMDVSFKSSNFMGVVQSLNANIKELPQEKQAEVSTMINLMQRDTLSPSLAAELRKEVGQYPDVLKSFDAAKQAEGVMNTAKEGLNKAQEPLLKAAAEQAMARFVLADVKALQGDTSAAVLLKQEAREQLNKTQGQIIGRPVEVKPPLQA